MRETSLFKADAMNENGEINIPLVILKSERENSLLPYVGFIPGFFMKNINSATIEDCKFKLKEYLVQKIKILIKNDEPFPFFPTKEEIIKEYENIASIDYIKIKSGKKQ